jgi:hypothetical protein
MHCKVLYTLPVKLTDFTVWCYTWWKNWVNCTVLTGNGAGLGTVLSSRLSHRELRHSLSKSHCFLSLPAETTLTSSQGTQPSKMNKREATVAFIEVYRSLPELWDSTFHAFFSSFWITLWLVFVYHSNAQEDTQNWQKNWQTVGKPVLCQRTFSSVFHAFFLHS